MLVLKKKEYSDSESESDRAVSTMTSGLETGSGKLYSIPDNTRGLHSTVSKATVHSHMNFLICVKRFPKNNRLKVEE